MQWSLVALVLVSTTVPCESERKMNAFIHLSPIAGGLGLCAEGPLPLARHRHWKSVKYACAMQLERQQEYSGQQKEIFCSRRAHLAHLGIVMCAALAAAPPAFADKMQKLSGGITVEHKEVIN